MLLFSFLSVANIHELCPEDQTTTFSTGPAYFATPHFTNVDGKYESSTLCKCTALPSASTRVKIELLYAELEGGYTTCYDYLSFNGPGKWSLSAVTGQLRRIATPYL